jgi:DNA-binding GntR family transcriptional regulator
LLRQEDIANQLGVSRLPVREALRRLEGEGLVVLRPRRGFMVASISRGEIVDIFESRALLESRAGYLATQVRDSEDVAETKRLLELSSHALLSCEPAFQRFYELNVEFHDRLLRPLRRPHLKRLVHMMRNAGERYIRMSVSLSEDLAPSAAEHRQIYDAYAAGEAEEVERLCHEHCIRTMRRLLKNIEEKGLAGKPGLPEPDGAHTRENLE